MIPRLALVGCKGPTEGPWTRARGYETGVRVTGLGEGERIKMILDFGGHSTIQELELDGTYPLPKRWVRARFHKLTDKDCHPTNVELINGQG